jgi:hypothetical protein
VIDQYCLIRNIDKNEFADENDDDDEKLTSFSTKLISDELIINGKAKKVLPYILAYKPTRV